MTELYQPSDPDVASEQDGTLTVDDVALIEAAGLVDPEDAVENGLTEDDNAADAAAFVASITNRSEHEAAQQDGNEAIRENDAEMEGF